MTQQTEAETIVQIRQSVRGMMTCALNDDMPFCVRHAQDLAAKPGVAAQALLELGEILDLALHAHCRETGKNVQDVWRGLCLQLGEQDQAVADAIEER
jgi:hypothetical protein